MFLNGHNKLSHPLYIHLQLKSRNSQTTARNQFLHHTEKNMYSIYKMASSTHQINTDHRAEMGVNLPEGSLNVDVVLLKSTH